MDDNIATVRAVWPDAEVWGPLRTGHRWMVMLPHGVSLADTIGDGDTEAEAWRSAAEQAGRESLRRSRGHGAKVGRRVHPTSRNGTGAFWMAP